MHTPQHPQRSQAAGDLHGFDSLWRLRYIAETSAGEHGVEVAFGQPDAGSFVDLDSKPKRITLDPLHCQTLEKATFVAAHEGAHISETLSLRQLGKTDQEIRTYAGMIGFHVLRNVIEDGAINDLLCSRFPKLQDYTLASYPRVDKTITDCVIGSSEVQAFTLLVGRPPLFAQALAGILNDWSELRHTEGFGKPLTDYQRHSRLGGDFSHAAVRAFFQSTLQEARHAISMIPRSDATARETARERYNCSVKRFNWCAQVLYPQLAKLIQIDIKDLGQQLINQEPRDGTDTRKPGQQTCASEAQKQAKEMLAGIADALRKLLQSLKESAEDEAPSTSEVVGANMQAEREAETKANAVAQSVAITRNDQEALNKLLPPYQQEHATISKILAKAQSRLADTFERQRHFRYDTGHPSGQQLNTLRAMHFELTGEGHNALWNKRIDPKYPAQDLVILLDRSGSMGSDNKYLHARRAMIFARELFQGLHIDAACAWFAGSAGTFVDFRDDISNPEVRESLMTLSTPLDEGTNDAAGLRFAASLFENRPPKHRRAIIMLSDAGSGQPKELRETVQDLAKQGIPVLHFGLGSGTRDQDKNYIHSWGDLNLHDESQDGFYEVFCCRMQQLAQDALNTHSMYGATHE